MESHILRLEFNDVEHAWTSCDHPYFCSRSGSIALPPTPHLFMPGGMDFIAFLLLTVRGPKVGRNTSASMKSRKRGKTGRKKIKLHNQVHGKM